MKARMKLAGVGIMAASLLMASTASAATPPTLSYGERGVNVGIMQRLLCFNGDPVQVTELVGPTTQDLVKDFQARQGLSVDGVVGPETWHRLEPTLNQGDSNSAVTVLQTALNDKEGAGLPVTGYFGTMTESAVINFQSHMGLTVDGVVGPETWDALIGHFVHLPSSGIGFFRSPGTISAWGSANTVATLEDVAWQWRQMGYKLRIGINDISLRHGGYFSPHEGHQDGMEADIELMRADGREGGVWSYLDPAYSRLVTQQLVNLLWSTGEVDYILFNDPNIAGVSPWPGHDDHLHIQFLR